MNCIVCKNIKSLSILPLTCLLVSAFWISSATAQVNGSGTSDSALFDTVITLTSDNSFLSGSIGGVDNETTQLNVPADTLVDFEFEANSGSEVNVNGGTLDLLFSVDQGEVNISGDSFVDSNFSATNSEVNISGG